MCVCLRKSLKKKAEKSLLQLKPLLYSVLWEFKKCLGENVPLHSYFPVERVEFLNIICIR